MRLINLAVRPADNPNPQAHTDNGEDVFMAFLSELGYLFDIEPDTLETKSFRSGRTSEGITPDIKLSVLPDGRTVDGLYIELTEADRYLAESQLPFGVGHKNHLYSASHRAYITPQEYLQRKQRKIDTAIRYHNVDIILLNWVAQTRLMATPANLTALLTPYLTAAIRRSANRAAL
jgi:hypothetical protein